MLNVNLCHVLNPILCKKGGSDQESIQSGTTPDPVNL